MVVILVTRVQDGEETLVGASSTATGACHVQDEDLVQCFARAFPRGPLDCDDARHRRLFSEISYRTEIFLDGSPVVQAEDDDYVAVAPPRTSRRRRS